MFQSWTQKSKLLTNKTERASSRWIDSQIDIEIDSQMGREIESRMDRQIGSQMDRQIDSQMDRQIDNIRWFLNKREKSRYNFTHFDKNVTDGWMSIDPRRDEWMTEEDQEGQEHPWTKARTRTFSKCTWSFLNRSKNKKILEYKQEQERPRRRNAF